MTPPAPAPRRVGLLDVVLVLLAVLLFVRGFLDWWGYSANADPDTDRTLGTAANGYRLTTAYPIVALGLTATIVALAGSPVRSRAVGLATTFSFLSAVFAVLAVVVKPSLVSAFFDAYDDSSDVVNRSAVKIGLILTVATAVLQFLVLLGARLAAIGRLTPRRTVPPPSFPLPSFPLPYPPYPAPPYPPPAYLAPGHQAPPYPYEPLADPGQPQAY